MPEDRYQVGHIIDFDSEDPWFHDLDKANAHAEETSKTSDDEVTGIWDDGGILLVIWQDGDKFVREKDGC